MSVTEIILTKPVNINAVKNLGTDKRLPGKNTISAITNRDIADCVYDNYVYYAKLNWHYNASSKFGGKHLLEGSNNTVPCGGLTHALKTVLTEAGLVRTDIKIITIPGYVWTKPEYKCFDSKVTGNIRRLGTLNYNLGCMFNEHYYLEYGNKFYDPCLDATYATKGLQVVETFNGPSKVELSANGARSKLMWTLDRGTCFLYLHGDLNAVPGFSGHWVMFDATKANLKLAMGANEVDEELKLLSGASPFAKFYNTLKA